MTIKLDTEKAYDKVDWEFINKCFATLGIYDTWIHWMIQCITTLSFKVIVNDRIGNSFQPEQEVRQGDSSPYIFIMCAEFIL